MLGNHGKNLGVPQENLAHLSSGCLAILERERDGHGGANPKVSFFKVRKKLTTQPRRDKEESSKGQGQFHADDEEAVSQRKT